MWKKSHMELESYPSRNRTSTAKYKQKVGEGLGKTKVVASTDVKKVKEGTTLGFHWIKDKYHKTIQKNQQSSYVFLSLRKTQITFEIFFPPQVLPFSKTQALETRFPSVKSSLRDLRCYLIN